MDDALDIGEDFFGRCFIHAFDFAFHGDAAPRERDAVLFRYLGFYAQRAFFLGVGGMDRAGRFVREAFLISVCSPILQVVCLQVFADLCCSYLMAADCPVFAVGPRLLVESRHSRP